MKNNPIDESLLQLHKRIEEKYLADRVKMVHLKNLGKSEQEIGHCLLYSESEVESIINLYHTKGLEGLLEGRYQKQIFLPANCVQCRDLEFVQKDFKLHLILCSTNNQLFGNLINNLNHLKIESTQVKHVSEFPVEARYKNSIVIFDMKNFEDSRVLELIQRLKNQPQFSQARFIIISQIADLLMSKLHIKAGFDAIFPAHLSNEKITEKFCAFLQKLWYPGDRRKNLRLDLPSDSPVELTLQLNGKSIQYRVNNISVEDLAVPLDEENLHKIDENVTIPARLDLSGFSLQFDCEFLRKKPDSVVFLMKGLGENELKQLAGFIYHKLEKKLN